MLIGNSSPELEELGRLVEEEEVKEDMNALRAVLLERCQTLLEVGGHEGSIAELLDNWRKAWQGSACLAATFSITHGFLQLAQHQDASGSDSPIAEELQRQHWAMLLEAAPAFATSLCCFGDFLYHVDKVGATRLGLEWAVL